MPNGLGRATEPTRCTESLGHVFDVMHTATVAGARWNGVERLTDQGAVTTAALEVISCSCRIRRAAQSVHKKGSDA
jgi:hypothetical protein